MGKIKTISSRVYGVGINDFYGPIHFHIDGKEVVCPFYSRWVAILSRCYSERVKKTCPSYEGCYVCDDWVYFSRFRSWMEKQNWEGFDLVRDFPFGKSRCFSPETCDFLPTSVTGIVKYSNSRKSGLPLGVYHDKSRNKFRACLTVNNKTISLGRFDSPTEAHKCWLSAKLESIIEFRFLYKMNAKIYDGISEVVNHMKHHINSGLEFRGFDEVEIN